MVATKGSKKADQPRPRGRKLAGTKVEATRAVSRAREARLKRPPAKPTKAVAKIRINIKKRMDQEKLKNQLERIAAQAPRWLFRGWSPAAGGGFAGLNSTKAIVPLAYINNPDKIDKPLHLKPDLRTLIDKHITWNRDFKTEFSSWTTCIDIAMRYANRAGSHPDNVHITIVDTKLLKLKGGFYWVPALAELGLAYGRKDFEWLAYGPIHAGDGMWTMAIDDLLSPKIALGFKPTFGVDGRNWSWLAPNDTIEKAVAKGYTFVKQFFKADIGQRRKWEPTFYVLILTWIVMQSPATAEIADFKAAAAIIWAIRRQTGWAVPANLWDDFPFHATYFNTKEGTYERCKLLVEAVCAVNSELPNGIDEAMETMEADVRTGIEGWLLKPLTG